MRPQGVNAYNGAGRVHKTAGHQGIYPLVPAIARRSVRAPHRASPPGYLPGRSAGERGEDRTDDTKACHASLDVL
ncbi:MAG: hypothetical protein Kow0067_17710 [Coriobacteriia bacterium]